jgi:hypothetical protein
MGAPVSGEETSRESAWQGPSPPHHTGLSSMALGRRARRRDRRSGFRRVEQADDSSSASVEWSGPHLTLFERAPSRRQATKGDDQMAPCVRSAPAMLPVPFLLGGWDGEHEIIRAAAVAS